MSIIVDSQKSTVALGSEHDGKCDRSGERRQRVVLAFGASYNSWLAPTYEPLRAEFDTLLVAPGQGEWNASRVRTSRGLLQGLPRRSRPLADLALSWLWPDWDRIRGIDRYLVGADIVHTVELCTGTSDQVARRKARYGYCHVVTVWENIAGRQSWHPRTSHVKSAVIRSADHFIAVSERTRTALLLEGIPGSRISVIGPGVRVTEISPRVAPTAGRFRLLFVGKKQRSKGVKDLLHALWLARQDPELHGVEITLTFLGIMPTKGPYADVIRRYDLGAAIREVPFVPYEQVTEYYREADALVLPSRITPLWQEQWGMVFMEAMQCGLPIITTDSGSISEVTGDAALYARPNDHHSLYLRLKELVLDGATWDRLSRTGLAARSRFDAELAASQITAVYRAMLSQKGAHSS